MQLKQFYRGDGSSSRASIVFPETVTTKHDDPAGYRATAAVKASVNVALNLGLPLLVTGEPGTGKSMLGKSVAFELGLQLIEFVAKSSTTATDLLYRFDAVRHFRDSQIRALKERAKELIPEDSSVPRLVREIEPPLSLAPYIRFEGLGRAIALTYPAEHPVVRTVWDDEANQIPGADAPVRMSRAVVLIDELDKAPRDVPNDLLVEIARGAFRVTETGTPLKVQEDLNPIVIITSNSEKSLPDAFLRRCVFHHIEFPAENELAKIIASRLPTLHDGSDAASATLKTLRPLARDGVSLLQWLRPDADARHAALRKPPSVAELLAWLQLLLHAGVGVNFALKSALRSDAGLMHRIEETLGVLVKDRADRQRVVGGSAEMALAQWARSGS